ncbi:hypothetical protein E2C01_060884 [Portunus trituberculatus]|uniref:Uncharacterized protein n=1 Tax=Portunus trituberculatus TaxID=210409 RepID=A0A5B7H6N6_PORTR|nr:hypothetical protein [Portunus trituberculatus]
MPVNVGSKTQHNTSHSLHPDHSHTPTTANNTRISTPAVMWQCKPFLTQQT